MKKFLDARARRWGYDGWALKVTGATRPLFWTVCTNRKEAREVKKEMSSLKYFGHLDVVKVKITVELVK